MSVEVERTDWLSYPTENLRGRKTEMNHRQGPTGESVKPPGGAFYPTIEVLNGLGKGVLKEAFQVFIQELNET